MQHLPSCRGVEPPSASIRLSLTIVLKREKQHRVEVEGLGEKIERCSEPIVLFPGLWQLEIGSGIGC